MLFFFLGWKFYSDHEETHSGLLLHLNSVKNWRLCSSRGPCAHLPPQKVQRNLGKSVLVLGSPLLVDDPELYLVLYSRYLPPPSWKILGGGSQLKDTGYSFQWKLGLGGAGGEGCWLKVTREYPPRWVDIGGTGLIERFQSFLSCRRQLSLLSG